MISITLPLGSMLKGKQYTYTIEKVLGQGSFGITYLGSTRMKVEGPLGTIETDVKVAIKEFFMRDINGRSSTTVTSSSQSGQYDYYRRKFKSEAENLSRLKHEHIINVFEFFEANNTVYYVMEYVSGGSLNDYICKKGKLGDDEVLKYTLQISSALSYMHGRNILHLDLKPGNIMLYSDGRAVLIDFGLAKQFDSKGNPESSTTIGQGTPGYAPLEQSCYNEDSRTYFPATMDIYALGATMFKMLTGKCPPPSSDILNQGFPVYELQQSGAGEEIISIVTRAMSPMVVNRYQTVDNIIKDVKAISKKEVAPRPKTDTINKPHDKKKEDSSTIITPQPKEAAKRNLKPYLAGIAVILIILSAFYIFNTSSSDKSVNENTMQGKAVLNDKEAADSVLVKETPVSNVIDGHEYVDLGLSVKWAACNIGADVPEDYGDYYVWAALNTKTKECPNNTERNDIAGNKEYDAASAIWGGGWRMPTEEEYNELIENSQSEWTSLNGVKGRYFKNPENENKIFLPACGRYEQGRRVYVGKHGIYWCSTPEKGNEFCSGALVFDNGNYYKVGFWYWTRTDRCTIRPVHE